MAHQLNVLEHDEYRLDQTPRTEETSDTAASGAWSSLDSINWTNVPEAELEEHLRDVFYVADANGNGTLQPDEIEALSRDSGLLLPEHVLIEVTEHIA